MGRGIFMSTDFGATWQVRHGFPAPIVTPTEDLVDAQDLVWQIDSGGNLVLTAAIVVTKPMDPLVSLLSGFYRSTDKGATWTPTVFEYIVNAADGSNADQTWIGPTTMATGGHYDGDPIYAAVTGRFPIPNFGPKILNFFKYEASTPIGPAGDRC